MALTLFTGIAPAQQTISTQKKKDIKEAGKTSTEATNVFDEIMKAAETPSNRNSSEK